MAARKRPPRRPMALATTESSEPSLGDRYFNRELSWIRFNERVLAQATDPRHPLLERVRFLAIFSNNLSEFFMVRVGSLTALALEGIESRSIDGQLPQAQLRQITEALDPILQERLRIWDKELLPALNREGIEVVKYRDLRPAEKVYLTDYFEREIYPILTPLAVDPGHPFPHISNLSLNLAIEVELAPGTSRFARLKIPGAVPRLVPLPAESDTSGLTRYRFVWIEDLIRNQLNSLFPGIKVLAAYVFRLVRDADQPLMEADALDLMAAMEDHLHRRHFGRVVRVEVEEHTPRAIAQMLAENLEVMHDGLFYMAGPLDFMALFELVNQVKRDDLKYEPLPPTLPPEFAVEEADDLFEMLRAGDRLVHHPFDAFDPVVAFVDRAADDPQVVAIKQTLYRVGNNAPVVEALLKARRAGKQVAVLVELKARFDEGSNIEWARALEDEGVHVVYGVLGLKTHCKVTLVIRREENGLRRYVHVGTGNYNASTARIYTDVGLFTARPEIGHDASILFNYLTSFAALHDYQALLVAPVGLRSGLIERIRRERAHAEAGRPAGIFFKFNSLTDREIIDELYLASQAGVRVQLLVRGICCLRPGLPDLSERIEVRSLIGRFLEHSRIYYFENDGEPEAWIGSADLMHRNLDTRVEVVAPVSNPQQKRYLLDRALGAGWADTCNAYRLCPDGSYERLLDQARHSFDSHRYLHRLHARGWQR